LLKKIKDELAYRDKLNGPILESVHNSIRSEVPAIEDSISSEVPAIEDSISSEVPAIEDSISSEVPAIEETNILEEIHSKLDSKFKLLKLDETGRSSLLFLNAGGQKKFCIGNDYEI
jgi:hypothetical protein